MHTDDGEACTPRVETRANKFALPHFLVARTVAMICGAEQTKGDCESTEGNEAQKELTCHGLKKKNNVQASAAHFARVNNIRTF